MKTIELLKSNFVFAVLRLTGKSFFPVLALNIFLLIVFMLIMMLLMAALFGVSDGLIESIGNGELQQSIYMAILSSMASLANRVMLVIFLLFLYLFSTWYYNFSFLIADEYFKNEQVNIMYSLKNSFSLRLFKTYIISLILAIVMIVVIIIASVFGTAFFEIGEGFGYTFVAILSSAVLVFFLRFLLVYPSALLSDKSIFKCFTDSFKKIDFVLAIKYFLVSLVLLVIYGLIYAANIYITGKFILYGNTFMVLYFILNLIISSLVTAFLVSITLGVYYGHNPLLNQEDVQLGLEENLIL